MYRVGVDLGGTNIATGVIDDEYRLISQVNIPTNACRSPEDIIDDVCRSIIEVLSKASLTIEQCKSVGIGVPGTCVQETGVVAYACNLKWQNVELAAMMKKQFDIPIFVNNDANCAVLAECAVGAAKGSDNVVLITLGTGIGIGAVINGKLFIGKSGAGMEMGHATIKFDGEVCSCGRRGCWEVYASGSALVRRAAKAAEQNTDSLLAKIGKINGHYVFESASKGDEAAKAVVDEYCYYVAEGLSNVVNIFAPDMILIGGGVCHEGEKFINQIAELTKNMVCDKRPEAMPIIKAAQFENEAGIIGAALLGIE